MNQVRLSGHRDSTPKSDVFANSTLLLESLPKPRDGSGNYMMYSRATLLKLLYGCEPWRPVTIRSEEDKYHPLKRPRTGDSVTCYSGSSPARRVRSINRLFRSLRYHRVSRWNSISKIACPAPGVLQHPPPRLQLPGHLHVRCHQELRESYVFHRPWPSEANKSRVVCSWMCDSLWRDEVVPEVLRSQLSTRSLAASLSGKIMHDAASTNIIEWTVIFG